MTTFGGMLVLGVKQQSLLHDRNLDVPTSALDATGAIQTKLDDTATLQIHVSFNFSRCFSQNRYKSLHNPIGGGTHRKLATDLLSVLWTVGTSKPDRDYVIFPNGRKK